jgi:hypothetical protein
MSWKFEIARGDLLPSLRVRLVNLNNTAVNLASATSITFVMTHEGTGRVVTGSVNVIAAALGDVEYIWVAGDTDVSGIYVVKWVAVFGARPMTFPTCPERRECLVEVCG